MEPQKRLRGRKKRIQRRLPVNSDKRDRMEPLKKTRGDIEEWRDAAGMGQNHWGVFPPPYFFFKSRSRHTQPNAQEEYGKIKGR